MPAELHVHLAVPDASVPSAASEVTQRPVPQTAPTEQGTPLEEWEWDEPDDEWACTHCGGEGWAEVEDPLWDNCDEFGYSDCPACGGTGQRKDQHIF